MIELQVQARALGDPTRHRIFQYLADAGEPADVAELTAYVELNHNAVRQHLAKLVAADLVIESTAPPTGRGRPRLLYEVHPSAESRWGVTGPYERLAVLLAEVVRSGETAEEVGRRAGVRLGRAARAEDPASSFSELMARQGFEPSVHRREDIVDVTLHACSFASAALADPDTVCDLHLGMARGVAEAVGDLVVDQLVPKDPRRAHCRLRCHLTHPTPA